MENSKLHKTVIICPLDWGLGHATRCVPIIQKFLSRGCKVVIAADNNPLAFIKNEFQDKNISYIKLPWKTIRYQKRGSFFLKLFFQLPLLLLEVFKEHSRLKKIISEVNPDLIISDNRYGLWSKKVKSVFITHQLFIKAPRYFRWVEPFIHLAVRLFINKYDQCWVPDMPGKNNLSGILAHKKELKNVKFIGILSRFSDITENEIVNPLPENFPSEYILVTLSGPEPQRSILEGKLIEEFNDMDENVVFLKGKADSSNKTASAKLAFFDHLPTPKLAYLLKNARLVICRSGYSSLMDLSVFNKRALLIPTPGQTEQEYLGKVLQKNKWALNVSQKDILLKNQIPEANKMQGIPIFEDNDTLLDRAIDSLLKGN